MKIQVLVAALNQDGHSLPQKMNIETDAIIANQCDRNSVEEFEFNGHTVKYLNFAERGVGLNRNNALMRADADICLFADDDVVYHDNYEKIILSEFEKHPEADIITFNFVSSNKDRPSPHIKKEHKLRWFNCLKFGTFRIAVRRDAVFKKNIFFSLLFGGGAKYQSGEDSLFITQCLRSGLKGYASTKYLGTVCHTDSTWFRGYNEKFFYDKGAWVACAFPKSKHFIKWYFVLRFKRLTELPFSRVVSLINDGIKGFKQLRGYGEGD